MAVQDSGTIDECGTGPSGGPVIDGGSTGSGSGGITDAGTQEPDSGTLLAMRLDAAGLWTNPNPLGQQRPAGALDRAEDIVIDRPGTACIRRGDDVAALEDTDPGVLNQGFDYSGYMYGWAATNGTLYRAPSGVTPINWDTVNVVPTASPDLRLPFATSAGDLYVLSSAGPYVMDGPTATPAVPGAPHAFDIEAVGLIAGSALPNNVAFAYVVVQGVNDSEGKPVLGQPSGIRQVTTNGAGPYSAVVTIRLRSESQAGDFVQLYRTQDVTSGTDPGATFYQVFEHVLTAADITAGTIQITDVVPDELQGPPLYTNPDRGGVRSDNVRPPLAEDVAPFRNRLWLANTTSLQRLTLRMIALPDDGDTIVIGGVTYRGDIAIDIPTNTYEISRGGTVSENIRDTMLSFVRVVNAVAANTTVTAYYVSGSNDAPGIVLLEGRSLGAAAFTASAAARGDRFLPSVATAISSLADEYPNRLHYSKDGLPYAFPLPNTLQVGAQEHGISRIVALRDALLVFKERGGDGLWKVTPSGAGWYVEQVNSSVQLVSSDALTVVDNTIFAWTEDGIVAITETGVEDIDVPIEDQINVLMLERSNAVPYVKAFGREALGERKVYFGIPTASVNGDGTDYMADTYVYNLNTETWTTDSRLWQGAYVNSDGRMVRFTAEGDVQNTYLERISGDALADRLGVEYAIAWNVETANNPGAEKQFLQVAVLTQEAQPADTDVYMYFTADDGEQSAAVETGGDGSNYIRAEVPWDRQRTTRLGVEMRGTVVNAINIVGLSVAYREYGGSILKGR